eukprot:m.109243 g.109243  ORF g.109243 m.109243 type:complete len:299 (-) comp12839_c0_seq5:1183-2079(-)
MQQKHAEYGGVLGAQDPSEIASLCKTVEAVVNQGPLSVGAVVKVAVDGVFVPAQVVRKVETNARDDAIKVGKTTEDHITISTEANDERTDDVYELLAESEVLRSRLPYKKVFATPITLPRSKIYAKEKSPRQPEPTETAVALAKDRGRTDTPKSVDPEYLAELMVRYLPVLLGSSSLSCDGRRDATRRGLRLFIARLLQFTFRTPLKGLLFIALLRNRPLPIFSGSPNSSCIAGKSRAASARVPAASQAGDEQRRAAAPNPASERPAQKSRADDAESRGEVPRGLHPSTRSGATHCRL